MRGQHHDPAAPYPRERPGTHLQEVGWASGPVWTGAENLAPTGIRSPDRPARRQSLYRLRYPAHTTNSHDTNLITQTLISLLVTFCPIALLQLSSWHYSPFWQTSSVPPPPKKNSLLFFLHYLFFKMIAVFLNGLNRPEVKYLNYPNLFLICYMHLVSHSVPFNIYCIISNSLLPHFLSVPVLGAFAKLLLASSCLSVRPS